MKFTGKLFIWIMVLVTAAFIAFGMWMLNFSFRQMLEQERQQASQEIRMFQYFLEVGYQSGEEYGEVYALQKAIESMSINVDRTRSNCIVLDGEGACYSGQHELGQLSAMVDVDQMIAFTDGAEENYYIWQICRGSHGYELVSMCDSRMGEKTYYLLISRNIQGIYDIRADTIRQYRVMLLVLLTVAAVCAWVLARYLTQPIRRLGWVAKRIAAGDLSRRSEYHRSDEVGELAESFNIMADRLVEQMREKELEAKRQEDFTSAFAHELKTPLTSIIGYAQMLDTMELDPEDHRMASHYIFAQGKRLEQLSHKLLELVSMEKQDFAVKPIKAMTLGENLWTTMQPIWEKRQVQGSIRMEQATLWGDSDLLLSLLYNLLDNATKAVGKRDRSIWRAAVSATEREGNPRRDLTIKAGPAQRARRHLQTRRWRETGWSLPRRAGGRAGPNGRHRQTRPSDRQNGMASASGTTGGEFPRRRLPGSRSRSIWWTSPVPARREGRAWVCPCARGFCSFMVEAGR